MPAHPRHATKLAALLLATLCTSAKADDGAASSAAGGIVMKHEPRITMQKEALRISTTKVQVDYEFRNDTDKDITTEVAFPVPGYGLDWDERSIKDQGFDDFQLTVENQPVHFDVETKAKLKGRDVSAQLKKYGVDIATFGHFNDDTHYAKDIRRLSPTQRAMLIKAGLLYPEDDQDEANWSVEKKYYWLQTFPAHAVVHISHEYTPVLGNSNAIGLGPTPNQDSFEAKSVCIDPSLRTQLSKLAANPENEVSISYVDFILTTANTWKTPIEDFTLIVERPALNLMQGSRKIKGQVFVSFCWDGPVTKLDADHFSAHLENFIPKKEITIGFITADDWFKGGR
jgi:hypothetical protein